MDAVLAMQRALQISQSGLGKTAGNPIVGAVIFNASGILAEGFHQSGPHAEVVALANLKPEHRSPAFLASASIAVTLEPCNHFGKTPPCTDAVIASGIKQVYVAVTDPNPVAAGGIAKLRAAGITVHENILEDQARWVNRAWLSSIEESRPYFTWKIAATLDGRTAAADGSSKWITSPESRAKVQEMRAQSDAIMVGTGTVIADDPHLIPQGHDARPLRVVVGNRAIAPSSRVLNQESATYLHTSHDFTSLIQELNRSNIISVLVEAGPVLGTAMLKAGLIDEIALFTAPKLLGSGSNFIADLGISNINGALTLEERHSESIGADRLSIYTFAQSAPSGTGGR